MVFSKATSEFRKGSRGKSVRSWSCSTERKGKEGHRASSGASTGCGSPRWKLETFRKGALGESQGVVARDVR